MKVKLFTHTDLDGVGCAILGILAFGKGNIDIEYCNYDNVNGKVEQFFIDWNFEYDKVFITDISVNKKVAENINIFNDSHNILCLLDHHPTALYLNEYNWCKVLVEDSKEKTSGTRLFYDWLINNKNENNYLNNSYDLEGLFEFVETVKQYDTWLWSTKYNDIIPKKINDLFHIKGRNRFIEDVVNSISYEGYYTPSNTDLMLLELEQEKINKYIKEKNDQIILKNILKYKAGVVFGEQYHSELGNRLAELNPELDFIVIINVAKAVSYRGIKDNIDLGKDIAKIYNGGGHPKAAGSQISDEIRENIINMIFEA